MVNQAKDAARLLKAEGISASVLDMYCIKPLDEEAIVRMAGNAKAVLTVEEHVTVWRTWFYGGTGNRKRMPEKSSKYDLFRTHRLSQELQKKYLIITA